MNSLALILKNYFVPAWEGSILKELPKDIKVVGLNFSYHPRWWDIWPSYVMEN